MSRKFSSTYRNLKKMAQEEAAPFLNARKSHMENKERAEQLLKKVPGEYKLYLRKTGLPLQREYSVYDMMDNKKFTLRGDLLSFFHPSVSLNNASGRQLGKLSLLSKKDSIKYSLDVEGMERGFLTKRISVKMKFDLYPMGWLVEGDLERKNFSVTDKAGVCIMSFRAAPSQRDAYILEIENTAYELAGLLLAMAVDIALDSIDE